MIGLNENEPISGCSSLCRQLVVDSGTNPKEFSIDGLYATVTLTGRSDVDLAVVSSSYYFTLH